jgi:hypothetical protein
MAMAETYRSSHAGSGHDRFRRIDPRSVDDRLGDQALARLSLDRAAADDCYSRTPPVEQTTALPLMQRSEQMAAYGGPLTGPAVRRGSSSSGPEGVIALTDAQRYM